MNGMIDLDGVKNLLCNFVLIYVIKDCLRLLINILIDKLIDIWFINIGESFWYSFLRFKFKVYR